MAMDLFERMRRVRAFVFDVDGVMTDSLIHIWENGDLTRTMNTRDGFALRRAVDKGYHVGVITGGSSRGVVMRLNGLGVTDVQSGVRDKVEALDRFTSLHDLALGEVMYMGDDLIDKTVMMASGLAAAPRDAVPEILEISHYVSGRDGGRGCVRDIIEKVMKVQGSWDPVHDGEKPGV